MKVSLSLISWANRTSLVESKLLRRERFQFSPFTMNSNLAFEVIVLRENLISSSFHGIDECGPCGSLLNRCLLRCGGLLSCCRLLNGRRRGSLMNQSRLLNRCRRDLYRCADCECIERTECDFERLFFVKIIENSGKALMDTLRKLIGLIIPIPRGRSSIFAKIIIFLRDFPPKTTVKVL